MFEQPAFVMNLYCWFEIINREVTRFFYAFLEDANVFLSILTIH